MAQVYCVRADIASIIGTAAVLAAIDDDQDGTESAEETLHVTNAIERSAVKMNGKLRKQYLPLSVLADNDWCKWCNAYLATELLLGRRANPVPPDVATRTQEYNNELEDAAWGRFQVPEQAPVADHSASVSNFKPEIGRIDMPIRVSDTESTGAAPATSRKRETTGQPGWW